MKKTRGKKVKSSSNKKSKRPISFFKKFLPWLIVIAVLLAIALLLNAVSTGNVVTGKVVGENVLEGKVSTWGDKVISFFNVGVSEGLGVGDTWKDLIIVIIVFVIILAGMYDILMLVSIFDDKWVIWVMSIGLAIVAALTGLVRGITIFLIQVAAGFGAIGIFLEIIISIFIFILLSFGSKWVAQWSANRQANKILAKATRGIGKMKAGARAIKEMGKEAAEGE
jgi:hypothetical protein